ncbi:MAG: hypothetical protein ACK46Q_06785 [Hyphomonas sp.]
MALLVSEAAGLECQPYENTDEVLAVSETHLIVLGEMHGTNESVEALRGLICAALRAGKPVRVGLEAAAWQGGPLNQLLRHPLDETAVLEAAPEMWQVEDGRSSAAIMALLKQLGEWRSAGFDVSVFAFDYSSGELSGEDPAHLSRSALMARHVDEAVSDFEGAVFVLTGEFHARKQAFDLGSERYVPMAAQVTRRPVLALRMVYGAGEAWVQAVIEKSDGSYEDLTGPLKLNGTALAGAPVRSFELAGDAEGLFDGSYYTGPITASPPAIRARSKD